jgi:hypothetical protein
LEAAVATYLLCLEQPGIQPVGNRNQVGGKQLRPWFAPGSPGFRLLAIEGHCYSELARNVAAR